MDIFRKNTEEIFKNAKLIKPSESELRNLAREKQIVNKYNILAFYTRTKARSPLKTFNDVNAISIEDQNRIEQEIKEVREYLKRKELICIESYIGENPSKSLKAISLVSKEFAYLSLMNKLNFFQASDDKEAEIKIIDIPNWKNEGVFVDPIENITYILGLDYYGELKMSHLRLAMHFAREKKNSLGLHAGSKIYRILKDGKLIQKHLLIFGLSGTGKTTITINSHGLKIPEGIAIMQDDINIWDFNSYCQGTEKNFYIKTDNVLEQRELLNACLSKDAVIENVRIDENGEFVFSDISFCANGRAMIQRREIPNTNDKIDMEKTDIILFNTRRYDIPIVGRLVSPEQATSFFLLGESTKTSAETTIKEEIGKSVRIPAFDPFIINKVWKNGKMFYDILKANKNIKVYLVSTGKIGGINGIKIKEQDTMKSIEGIVRDTIEWKFDENVGYDIPKKIDGVNLEKFNPYKIYDEVHFKRIMKDLRNEREGYLKKFEELDFLDL